MTDNNHDFEIDSLERQFPPASGWPPSPREDCGTSDFGDARQQGHSAVTGQIELP